MTQATIHQAKTHLSKLIRKALGGEEVVIANRDKPLVRLQVIKPPKEKRRLGWAKGLVSYMSPDFDAELKDFEEYMSAPKEIAQRRARKKKEVRVLIDTQVIIWLATGVESRLSAEAKRCFHRADELFLSVVSYWEIAIKRGIGKLRWDEREEVAFERGLRENQIQELALRRIHCEKLVTLRHYHRDPFDRMLIAQAQVEGLSVMTADPHFTKYDLKVVW